MLGEWPEYPLEELCELIVDCPHSTPKWVDQGVVVLRNQYIRNGRLDLSDPSYTTEEGYKARIKRAVPTAGDLVLTREAPMGEVCKIPEGLCCCLGQRMVLIRANKDLIDPDYLLFVIQSPYVQHQISWSEGTGTTVSNIRLPDLRGFKIPTPSLGIQRWIAGILKSLDDKTALNRQINTTLESMAQTLFKSWFVNFDPVIDNALAAGNKIPEPLQTRAEKRTGLHKSAAAYPALPDEIKQLFPDSFVFTEEMGWVPEGWEIFATEQVSQKIGMGPFGSNIKVSTFVDSGIPVISGKHLNETLLTDYDYNFITEEHSQKLKNSKVFPGDVVFTHAGNIGQVSLIPQRAEFLEYMISQRQFYLRPDREKVTSSYIVSFYRSNLGQHMLLSNASQVGVPSIARPSSHLKAIPLLIPSMGILRCFEKHYHGIYDRLLANRKESEVLSNLRDSLLPKLLSGQLSIPEAEQALDEVV